MQNTVCIEGMPQLHEACRTYYQWISAFIGGHLEPLTVGREYLYCWRLTLQENAKLLLKFERFMITIIIINGVSTIRLNFTDSTNIKLIIIRPEHLDEITDRSYSSYQFQIIRLKLKLQMMTYTI